MKRLVGAAAALDVVSIVVFVTVGRSSHEEGVTLAGVASTAWPFLVGATVGWLVSRAWQRPTVLVPTGLVVWLGTVSLGMVLRGLAGHGTALSFTIVATGFLAATLLGWRLVMRGLRSLATRRAREHTGSVA